MGTRTQEKGAVTPQETEPNLPLSVQESLVGVEVDSGLLLGQGHWLQQSWELQIAGVSPFDGGHHYCLRPNYRQGTQAHPSAENQIKELLSMALPTRPRPSFTHRQSLPPGSFHKPLIFTYQKADRMKTTVTEN